MSGRGDNASLGHHYSYQPLAPAVVCCSVLIDMEHSQTISEEEAACPR